MNLAFSRNRVFFAVAAVTLLIGAIVFSSSEPARAQPATDPAHAVHPAAATDAAALAKQISELRDKLARVEAALPKGQSAGAGGAGMKGMGSTSAKAGGSMKGMGGGASGQMAMMDMDMMDGMGAKKPAMGMMDDDMMGGMSGGMEDMDMMEMMGMMGMAPKSAGGMGGMKSMGKMQMKAALPSFPGASHIYHVGATDFFLNHPEHISLTPKQKVDLGRLKEKAVLAKTSAQRKIDEAEQELWTLTSADEPDAPKIEAKIREIEVLRGDQRMAFIRAVGDAAKLLTDEQRQALLGTGTDKADKAAKPAKPDPHAGHKP